MTQPESKESLKIQKAMRARGAYVWKVHGNEYTPAGTPDICGSYRGRFVGVETKMPGGKCSAIQEYRIGRMRIAGALIVAPCYTVAQALEMLDLIDQVVEPPMSIHSMEAPEQLRLRYGVAAVFSA